MIKNQEELDDLLDEIINDKDDEEEDFIDEDIAVTVISALESVNDMIDVIGENLSKGATKNFIISVSKGLATLRAEAAEALDVAMDEDAGIIN